MAVLTNMDGTSANDVLTYDKGGNGVVFHTKGGNDKVTIADGSISLVNDGGTDSIIVWGGSGHNIVGTGSSVENITSDGGNAIEAQLGDGKDTIALMDSNGRKATGGNSSIRGGGWTDTFTTEDGAQNYQLYGDAGDDIFNINGGKNMNFWGGAANDTFVVKGGTNNKLYGGDSADKFEIYAANQNMILGYGNDIVNINQGDNQQIKGNLGINTINLMAGSGHVITADIDQAASKKAGKEVGYGQDKVYISGTASNITANLGDGKDVVEVSSGSGHQIYTEGWGDTILISGNTSSSVFDAGAGDDTIIIQNGTDNVVVGGTGSDIYSISNLKANTRITIKNGDKLGSDQDVLQLLDYARDEFECVNNNGVVTMTRQAGEGIITVEGWNLNPLAQVVFKDGVVNADQLLLSPKTLYIRDGNLTGSVIFQKQPQGNLDGYKVVLENYWVTDIKTVKLDKGNATNNQFVNNGGGVTNDVFVAEVNNGKASNNSITINKGTIDGQLCAAYVSRGDVTGNSVTIEGGTVKGEVYGALCYSGQVSHNTVTITGGKINNYVYGGRITGDYYTLEEVCASDNEIILKGGTINGMVIGGAVGGGNMSRAWAENNNITLQGNAIVTMGVITSADQMEEKNYYDDSYISGSITIKDKASAASLRGGAGVDTITVQGEAEVSIEINGMGGKDVINIEGGNVGSVDGGAAADTITVTGGYVGYLTGGAGNDTIVISGGKVDSVNGGAGSDTYIFNNLEAGQRFQIHNRENQAGDKDVLKLLEYSGSEFEHERNGNYAVLTHVPTGAVIAIDSFIDRVEFRDNSYAGTELFKNMNLGNLGSELVISGCKG